MQQKSYQRILKLFLFYKFFYKGKNTCSVTFKPNAGAKKSAPVKQGVLINKCTFFSAPAAKQCTVCFFS